MKYKVLLDGLMIGTGSGGDASYVLNLAQSLVKSPDFEPWIAVTKFGANIADHENLPYIVASGPRVLGPLSISSVARRLHPDVIHTQYFPAMGTSAPVVTTIHDMGFVKMKASFSLAQKIKLKVAVSRSLRRASTIIVVSQKSYDDLVNVAPDYADKIAIIPNGISLAKYNRSTTPINSISPYILWIGNDEPRKNLQRLLYAYKKSKDEWPSLRLLVAGKISLMGCQAINSVGGESLGFVSYNKVVDLIYGATGLVYPSLFEGFGFPPLEALACGIPSVVHRELPLCDYVRRGLYGVDATSIQELTEAILRLRYLEWTREELVQEAGKLSSERTRDLTTDVYRNAIRLTS